MTMNEEWRPVPLTPGYEVSDLGAVRSWRKRGGNVAGLLTDSPRLLSLKTDRYGYRVAALKVGDRMRHIGVHRLVVLAFVGEPPPGKPEVCHRDGVRTNNVPSNLYWGSGKDNGEDKVRHGNSLRGERSPWAKLTAADIPEIFRLRRAGCTQKAIARQFGVASSLICYVLSRKGWKHVLVELES
jgi:hypothetical protein